MATIKDIAEKVGVNITTVSRVLNNRGYISDTLKQAVQNAMKELNYQPNEIARSLTRRKSNIIGLIIPTVSHLFFGEIASYIEYYAYEHGYKILLCNSQRDKQKEQEYVDMLKASQVDGIIMGSQTMDVQEFEKIYLPLVSIDRRISEEIPYVCSDNYNGGKLATDLLISKGCRKIAHISGNLSLNLLANSRYEAFLDTAKKHNVWNTTVQNSINGLDFLQYTKVVSELFEKHPDLDGIFASNDVLAAFVIKACVKMGKRVPEDVKVVGYDGTFIGSFMPQEITTIRQPIEEMAKLAVELIIKQIQGVKVDIDNILPVKLLEKGTT